MKPPGGVPASELAAAAAQVLSNYLVSNAQVVNWSPMPEQQEVQELGTGLLKAALLTEPYLYEAESQYGDAELLDAFSGQTANMPMSGYVATAGLGQGELGRGRRLPGGDLAGAGGFGAERARSSRNCRR